MTDTRTDATDDLGRSTPLHDAHDLTDGGGEARIRLGDMTYRLTITRAGKLILTK